MAPQGRSPTLPWEVLLRTKCQAFFRIQAHGSSALLLHALHMSCHNFERTLLLWHADALELCVECAESHASISSDLFF